MCQPNRSQRPLHIEFTDAFMASRNHTPKLATDAGWGGEIESYGAH